LNKNDKDILLSYLDIEIDAYRKQGFQNIIKIEHPLVDSSKPVFDYLYGPIKESESILILPTYSNTSSLLEMGWDSAKIIEMVAERWCSVIDKLLEKFPCYEVKLKLHPASKWDKNWMEIITRIQSYYPDICIINPNESADYQVALSKIIVGDVTSALWSAGMNKNKTVISLDIFEFPGGKEMKQYKDIIIYIDDINKIKDLDFAIMHLDEKNSFNKSVRHVLQ